MDANYLATWCSAKRGRLSALAAEIGRHRQQVHQWLTGDRPLPEQYVERLRKAMGKVQKGEK